MENAFPLWTYDGLLNMGTVIGFGHGNPSGNHRNLCVEWMIVTLIYPFSGTLVVKDGTLGVSGGTLGVSDGTLGAKLYACETSYPYAGTDAECPVLKQNFAWPEIIDQVKFLYANQGKKFSANEIFVLENLDEKASLQVKLTFVSLS